MKSVSRVTSDLSKEAPAASQSRKGQAGPRRTGSRPIVRQALVESAVELFKLRGFDDVTVAEIADHAGLARRTFFLHFSSKEDALIAWLDDEWQLATDVLLTQSSVERPFEAYSAALKSLGAHFDQNREHAVAVTRIILSTPALFGRQYARQDQWAARWASELRHLHGKSGDQALRYEIEAAAAFSVLATVAQRWIDDPKRRSFRSWLDRGVKRVVAIGTTR
jgi:AcrR family transcriptional regulator